jgi:site-specific recombinase XerD
MDEIQREPMSKDDYELLKQATIIYNNPDRQDIILRDQLLFEIPRETGLRISEIVRCRFEDFYNKNRQFKIEVK